MKRRSTKGSPLPGSPGHEMPEAPPGQPSLAPPGALWLSFFGKPLLIHEQGALAVSARYQKTLALLAHVSSQPNRPLRRDTLAELFWPHKPLETSKGNLRVVLNDLSTCLGRLGLETVLETNRQWLTFRGAPGLYTDETFLRSRDAWQNHRHLITHLAENSHAHWGDCLTLDEASSDWNDWLISRQAYLDRLREECQAELENLGPSAAPAAAPALPGSAPELAHMALMRIETASSCSQGPDERTAYLAWRQKLARITEECAYFGGLAASIDATGVTMAFGLHSLQGNYRWQALRAAAAIEYRFGDTGGLRIALSAGNCIVEWTPGPLPHIAGWRGKWVERLAYLIPPGQLIADEGFADMAHLFGLEGRDFSLDLSGQKQQLFVQDFEHYHLPELPPLNAAPSLVGRHDELQRLQGFWQESQRGSNRRVVVTAPPGMGKTRLVWEFARQRLGDGARLTWLGARSETASQPWSLIYDWLLRARQGSRLGFGLDHSKEQILQQFLAHRSIPLSDKGEFERLLLQLLGSSSLIVVDDAHWLDQASARLLSRVLPQLENCLILITQRKTGSPHFALSDSYTLALQPLSDQASEELLDNLCAPTPSESRRATILLARCVPIYLLTASREARLNMPTTEFLAATLNAVRASLPTLGAAALLGLQWKLSDLTTLVDRERALQAIQQGQEAHILCNHDADHWAFFHPLIHETILQSLPAQDRERLAADAARLYMARNEFGRAAPLWETAGRIDEARRNWRAAAESACREQDALAACTYYDQLERLGYSHSTQDLWDRIRHTRVRAVRDGYGNEATCSTSREILELLPPRPNPEEQEIEYSALSLIYLWSGKGGKGKGLEQGTQLMDRANTPVREFAANWALGNTHFWLGNFSEARPYLLAALDSPLPAEERTRYFPSDPVALACPTYGWCLWYLGEADWEEKLLRYLERILADGIKQNICIATTLTASAYFGAGYHGKSIEYAQQAHAIATAEGFTLWEVFSALSLFAASAHSGLPVPVEYIHAFEEATNHAYPAGINSARWLGAEALVASGRLDLAEAMADRALANADTAEHAHCLPSLWRLKSDIATARGNAREAGAAMANAERIALGQGARGWIRRWGRQTCAALPA